MPVTTIRSSFSSIFQSDYIPFPIFSFSVAREHCLIARIERFSSSAPPQHTPDALGDTGPDVSEPARAALAPNIPVKTEPVELLPAFTIAQLARNPPTPTLPGPVPATSVGPSAEAKLQQQLLAARARKAAPRDTASTVTQRITTSRAALKASSPHSIRGAGSRTLANALTWAAPTAPLQYPTSSPTSSVPKQTPSPALRHTSLSPPSPFHATVSYGSHSASPRATLLETTRPAPRPPTPSAPLSEDTSQDDDQQYPVFPTQHFRSASAARPDSSKPPASAGLPQRPTWSPDELAGGVAQRRTLIPAPFDDHALPRGAHIDAASGAATGAAPSESTLPTTSAAAPAPLTPEGSYSTAGRSPPIEAYIGRVAESASPYVLPAASPAAPSTCASEKRPPTADAPAAAAVPVSRAALHSSARPRQVRKAPAPEDQSPRASNSSGVSAAATSPSQFPDNALSHDLVRPERSSSPTLSAGSSTGSYVPALALRISNPALIDRVSPWHSSQNEKKARQSHGHQEQPKDSNKRKRHDTQPAASDAGQKRQRRHKGAHAQARDCRGDTESAVGCEDGLSNSKKRKRQDTQSSPDAGQKRQRRREQAQENGQDKMPALGRRISRSTA
ncbi:hypothetical protein AURDEDRAFT_160966 [Auricularia subglabra TFB-10046 SS5]|nr:hypothetical protein AURDEDRAFT_160966 [Auricularia subglabra TFB-10046 SS5]